ncbi:serine/threonine-protein kinase RIO3-like [Diadema setosum]|uniref:serine/threonine-protein kinase RIO3-like n=1 Tax=Diadema setosum TaxID=31175 RepID=UPI003B3B8F6F
MSTGGKVAWPAANPWGKGISANVSSLSSVMDEEYAKQLQTEEEAVITADATADSASPLLEIPADLADEMGPETSSDLLLAQMLQLQFDREYDAELAREEQKCNGSSKVGISFSNYRSVHPAYDDDVDDDEEDFQEDWIQGDGGNADFSVGKTSDQGKKKNIVTKHDAQVCGRKNASRVMDQFPPAFPSGNSIGMDMKLSNSVYNVLKIHSQKEENKAQRLHEKKEHSTAEMAVDSRTRIMLYKLVNNGLLDSITGSISTGKEAVVIHAYGGQMDDQIIPAECALKVFKTTLNEFKTRDQYIRNDYRFRARFKKKNPRRFIHMWAEKEMHNLTRIRESGIRCPEVVLLRKHILVMSFIGKEQKAAPKLKHVRFSTSEAQCVYEECLRMVEKLYQECNLIHADLSEYNMLWHEGHIWLIDVSQSVEPTHPHGLEFLLRDCTNVSNFFTKMGVHGVLKPHEMFNRVTGLDLECGNEQQFLAQIDALQQSEKFKPSSPKETNFAFDYFFEKVKSGDQDEDEEEDDDAEEEEEEEEEAVEKKRESSGRSKGKKRGSGSPRKQ